MKYSHRSNYRNTCPHDPETRAQLGSRLRYARLNLGWSIEDAGKYFQVTDRTWHNWESGAHRIPYAVYKLLRVLARLELPGKAWAGWRLEGDVLITPEGRQITPKDGSWWSLLVRRAAGFDACYNEAATLRKLLIQVKREASQEATGAPVEGPRLRGGTAGRTSTGSATTGEDIDPPPVTRGETSVTITSSRSGKGVIMTSWPIPSDSPKPLTPQHAARPITLASALTPLSVLPWTPTCGLRVSLLRPEQSQHRSPEQSPRLRHLSQLPGQFGKRQAIATTSTPSRVYPTSQAKQIGTGSPSGISDTQPDSSQGGAL